MCTEPGALRARHRLRCWALVTCALLLLSSWPRPSQAEFRYTDEPEAVSRVLSLLDQRLALMPAVAADKWQRQVAIQDPVREQAVIERAVASAASMGLAGPGVRELLALQMRFARDLQQRLHDRWQRDGYDFAGPVPSLTEVIRPQLDRLTAELLRALYLAAPACERETFAANYAPALHAYPQLATLGPAAFAELLQGLARVRRATVPAAERVRASGFLRIGTPGDYAPFSFESHDRLRGADIEMAAALAEALELEPVFIRTSWPTLSADLGADRFDLAVGGISITTERARIGAFSRPYHQGGKTIIARCGDARRFRSLRRVDRPEVRVVVNPGGTNERYVREHLHRARLVLTADNRGVFDELLAGRADVMITDDTEVELQTRRHAELCRTLPGTLTRASKAILTTHDGSLLPQIDAWLVRSLADGEPQRWLQQALAVP